MKLNNTQNKPVPENEIVITFARSSGAGGQNVNKTSTKAILHWSVKNSSVFSDDEKKLISEKLANRLNNDGEIVIHAEEKRSQAQNKEQAIARLQELVSDAMVIPKIRKPTRPTKISKLKRLESKKIRSEIKSARRAVTEP